jgi:hypothetical protein
MVSTTTSPAIFLSGSGTIAFEEEKRAPSTYSIRTDPRWIRVPFAPRFENAAYLQERRCSEWIPEHPNLNMWCLCGDVRENKENASHLPSGVKTDAENFCSLLPEIASDDAGVYPSFANEIHVKETEQYATHHADFVKYV